MSSPRPRPPSADELSAVRRRYRARHSSAQPRRLRLETMLSWVAALAGIGVMIGFVVSALLPPGSEPELAGPDPTRITPAESAPAPATSAPPSAPPPQPDPEPDLAARYRLEEAYPDGFIANVVIVNRSAEARSWTVQLAFLPDVGELNTFWIEDTPLPAVQQAGSEYIISSTVEAAAGSQVVLKLQFGRSGPDIAPASCTVDGADCAR